MYIEPTYSGDVAVLQTQRDQYDTALHTAKRISFRIDELTTQYNSFAVSDIERLEKLLPESIDEIRLLMDVNDIAVSRGVAISNIAINGGGSGEDNVSGTRALGENPGFDSTIRGKTIGGSIETTEITFSVTASYFDFNSFLRDLEKSLRIIDVTTVGISAVGVGSTDTDTEVSDIYEFNVSVDTYWLESKE